MNVGDDDNVRWWGSELPELETARMLLRPTWAEINLIFITPSYWRINSFLQIFGQNSYDSLSMDGNQIVSQPLSVLLAQKVQVSFASAIILNRTILDKVWFFFSQFRRQVHARAKSRVTRAQIPCCFSYPCSAKCRIKHGVMQSSELRPKEKSRWPRSRTTSGWAAGQIPQPNVGLKYLQHLGP